VRSFQEFRRAATVGVLGLMLACGSSDSGLELTAANAQTIAAQSMNTSEMLEGMAEMFDGFDDVIETQNALQVMCTDGNFTQDINDVEPMNQISTGDSVSFMFNGCVMEEEGSVVSLDGGISVTIDEVTGVEGSAFTRKITFEFDALTMEFDGLSIGLNGGFTVEASSTDGTDLHTMIMGEMFSAVVRFGSQTESIRLYGFDLMRSVDAQGGFTISYNAEITSSQNGGTVTFETLAPFTGQLEGDPSAGSLRITGDGGGEVIVTALDAQNVEILVNTDDDPEPEATIKTTWDALQNGG
jgi:hypothetical protein